jgi:hypothetical protein
MPFSLADIETLEQDEDATPESEALALQRAINSGMWSLQGSYGRAMMAAIETGRCMLGPAAAHDYWGNRIPARTEVQEGTKGSRQFVAERFGEDWAEMLEGA